jgi:hypothetical protein
VFWQAPDENRLTQAYYNAGAWIVDFKDPANAVALGNFTPDGGATYWSNKPHKGYLYASNMRGTLDVLRYTGQGWPATAGPAEVQRSARQGVPYVPIRGTSPAPPRVVARDLGRFAFTAIARKVPGRKGGKTALTVSFTRKGRIVGRVTTKRAAGRKATLKVAGVAVTGTYRWTLKAGRRVLDRGTIKVVRKAGLSLSPGATMAARVR